ncbi:DUF4124 domain-containing protein [Noviherbaspirillum saxi]|uniref:DUF4124 domain-containing protein n=1 Tax=Noviherbaspirillum saxi TaxID=2320863 RepID=A0A3A3GDA9_9BURK|nr:DUF4124 domain-containing protein [Noviherbaspirillum saxi]RJF98879.1 DUF4124 domain-containing protein [Noviherbaspirillum saxi]
MSPFVLRSTFIGALFLCLSNPALAVYRCEADGKVSYSDIACPSARQLDIKASSAGPTPTDKKRLAEEKKFVERAEKARHKEEAAEEKARQRAARQRLAQDKKCDALARRQRWASEDVSAATQKSAEKARRKASRVNEQYEAECGARRTELLHG